mgnify:CR=1 FL=1
MEVINETTFLKTFLNSDIGLSGSRISSCLIKNRNDEIITNKTKYLSILIEIWRSMDTCAIEQHTTFTYKTTNEHGVKGYKWYPELKLSLLNKNARGTMKEIIHLIKMNNYTIDIFITLKSGQIINYIE